MTYTKAEPIKRYCKSKQVMCGLANESGYCRITACANPSSFPKTYTSNRTNYKGGNEQMTKEEARIRLITKREELMHKYEFKEAEVLTMAIEALKAQDRPIICPRCGRTFAESEGRE